MTAKTGKGDEIFHDSTIYMPQSAIFGRGDFMWPGGNYPGRKSGMVRDTSLQPEQTRQETFEIKYPYEDVTMDGKTARKTLTNDMSVSIKLWYLPGGGDPRKEIPGKTEFLFYETEKSIHLKEKEDF